MRKIKKFSLMIWLLALTIAIWLCGWPLLMNIVAEKTWKNVPCVVVQESTENLERYHYIYNNVRHTNRRRDFWEVGPGESIQSRNLELPKGRSTECYVNPSDPNRTVLYLQGITDLSRSGKSVGFALMDIIVAVILSSLTRRK